MALVHGGLIGSSSLQRLALFNIVVVPNRFMSWGNVNRPNKRGRFRPNRHWDPQWKKERADRIVKIPLPQYEVERRLQKSVDPAARKEHLKKMGRMPVNPEQEYATYITSSREAFDNYIPSEEETKSTRFWLQEKTYDPLKGKTKSFRATRKIRQYEPEFDPRDFVLEAKQIYINAHKALAGKKTQDEMLELVTENIFPEMMHNARNVSIYWDLVDWLEDPKLLHVRAQPIIESDNLFGQCTVRFFSKQILAVYDRFGRLIHGHPHVAKDVLEFAVFEKHVVNTYGKWRLHTKIVPPWLASTRAPGSLTHILNKEELKEVVKHESEQKTASSEDDHEDEKLYDKNLF